MCHTFRKDLQLVSSKMNERMSFPDHLPPMAGLVQHARDAKHSLDRPLEVSSLHCSLMFFCLIMSHINNAIHPFLVLQVLQKVDLMLESRTGKQNMSIYSQTMNLLDDTQKRNFAEWSQNLELQYFRRLEQPLMIRCKDNSCMLDLNFDKWVP